MRKVLTAVAIAVCVGVCLSGCSAPGAAKNKGADSSASSSSSSSASAPQSAEGSDRQHYASSLKAYAEWMLKSDDDIRKDSNSTQIPMSDAQRDIINRAIAHEGKVSRADYEQSWMNFRSCIMNRGWTDPKPTAYGGFYAVPSMNEEGMSKTQDEKLVSDLNFCSISENTNTDQLYRTQESNPELSTDSDQLLVNCLIQKKVAPTSYTKEQFSKDWSSDSAPAFFSSAEAQECFTLYQYGVANAQDADSYWKPLG
ncbi:hypothetical protein KIH75_08875 [Bifidobacterium sp. 64T4]|uniref:hypothetical protein n=1 Tax=Bifidobacterium pongonis TaxID=2834432 RepID=UPI001C59141F|nr:hypothetical protein [Bifidobacterium pongonis]MBW3095437.1 hypothetical protein [Bifidobacterium pongonis]